jgi:hypothetical protein
MTKNKMPYEKYQLDVKVLEAGGDIESRCINPPVFTTRYVFTKEQLEKFIEKVKNETL